MKALLALTMLLVTTTSVGRDLMLINFAIPDESVTSPLQVALNGDEPSAIEYKEFVTVDAQSGDVVQVYDGDGTLIESRELRSFPSTAQIVVIHGGRNSQPVEADLIDNARFVDGGCALTGEHCAQFHHYAPAADFGRITMRFRCMSSSGASQIIGGGFSYGDVRDYYKDTPDDLAPHQCVNNGAANIPRTLFWPDARVDIDGGTTVHMFMIGDGVVQPPEVFVVSGDTVIGIVDTGIDLETLLPTHEKAFRSPSAEGAGLLVESLNGGSVLYLVEYFHDDAGIPRWRGYQVSRLQGTMSEYEGFEFVARLENEAVQLEQLGAVRVSYADEGVSIERTGAGGDLRFFPSSLD